MADNLKTTPTFGIIVYCFKDVNQYTSFPPQDRIEPLGCEYLYNLNSNINRH